MDFEQSIKYCHNQGAYLIEIDSADKELFIENSVPVISNLYWIGLKDIIGDNRLESHIWLHSNQSLTEVSYQNWYPNNPNHLHEQCVILRNYPPFLWFDRECEDLYKPICEKGTLVKSYAIVESISC